MFQRVLAVASLYLSSLYLTLVACFLGRKYGLHFQGRMKQLSLQKGMQMYTFLVIKITSTEQEGFWFQHTRSFGRGYLYDVFLHNYSCLIIRFALYFLYFPFELILSISGTKQWIQNFATIMKWFRRWWPLNFPSTVITSTPLHIMRIGQYLQISNWISISSYLFCLIWCNFMQLKSV